MSVQTNTYILVGQKFSYDEFTEDEHESLLEDYRDSAFEGIAHKDGLCAIVDGMNGQYVFIGRVLEKTNDQDGDYGFNGQICLNKLVTGELVGEVSQLLQDQFEVDSPDVQTWVFTHCR